MDQTSKRLKILITGASRGLGKSLAQMLFERGHIVYGTSTQSSSYDYLEKCFKADFRDSKQLEDLCCFLPSLGLDALVNNAGINLISPFLEITDLVWQDQYKVNVYAPYRLTQAALPHMITLGTGHIINIASVWSKISKTGRAAYSSNKAALFGMTQSLSAEFSHLGVLFNCVSPGFIDTDLTQKNLGEQGIKTILQRVPMDRLASPEEVAKFVVWLLEENRYITGQNLVIDGGFTSA